MRKLGDMGWSISPVPWCEEGFFTKAGGREDLLSGTVATSLGSSRPHLVGEVYGQEPASMLPVEVLKAALAEGPVAQAGQGGPRILDLCAAPGSKATQLGAWLRGSGVLVANEPDSKRAGLLRANLIRAGIHGFLLTRVEGQEFGALAPELFDAVLVDVPCSSSGTVRKYPEVLDRWREPARFEQLVNSRIPLQRELLHNGWQALRPGGVLVYSTCTFNLQESEDQCQWLKEACSAHSVDLGELLGLPSIATDAGYLRVWPQTIDGEGFFVACFRKETSSGHARAASSPPDLGSSALRELDPSSSEKMKAAAQQQLGCWPIADGVLVEDEAGIVRSLPRLDPAVRFLTSHAFEPGIRVGKRMASDELELGQELLLLAGDRAGQQAANMDNASWIEAYASAGGGVGASTMSMERYAAEGDIEKAEGALAQMQGKRLDPNIVSYTLLMKTHVKAKRLRSARELLTDLKQKAVEVDLICYSTLLDAYAEAGNVAGAEEMLEQIKCQNLTPNLTNHNMLIKAHAKAGSPARVERLMAEMRSGLLAPDVVSYTTLIGAHAQKGDVAAAEQALAGLQAAGLEPNLRSCNAVLRACGGARDAEAAGRVFAGLRQRRLRPNVFSYTFLVEAHARAGDLERAAEILEQAWLDGVEPSMRTYNALVKAHLARRDVGAARLLLSAARSRGLAPDLASWTMLIGAFARNGNIEGAEEALREMQGQRLAPDLVCYNTLVSMYQRRELPAQAEQLLEDMRKRRLRTDPWSEDDSHSGRARRNGNFCGQAVQRKSW